MKALCRKFLAGGGLLFLGVALISSDYCGQMICRYRFFRDGGYLDRMNTRIRERKQRLDKINAEIKAEGQAIVESAIRKFFEGKD